MELIRLPNNKAIVKLRDFSGGFIDSDRVSQFSVSQNRFEKYLNCRLERGAANVQLLKPVYAPNHLVYFTDEPFGITSGYTSDDIPHIMYVSKTTGGDSRIKIYSGAS